MVDLWRRKESLRTCPLRIPSLFGQLYGPERYQSWTQFCQACYTPPPHNMAISSSVDYDACIYS